MKRFFSRPSASLGQCPLGAAGVVLLPILGGLLLFGAPSRSALAQGASPAPVSQFPDRPTPEGDVSLQNLHFQPLEASGFPAFTSKLKVAYRDNTVTITDAGKGEEAVVWSGPVTDASFIQETAGGIHTLKDGSGAVLWTDAADLAKPDLLFEKALDGRARLTDKAGATLWSGPLPPTPHGGGGSQSSGSTGARISIITPSIRVEGVNGVFRVTSGKLLWAGHLSPSPLIVIRDGHTFTFTGPNGGGSGSDEVSRISLEGGAETVTVADTKGRMLGMQAVDALTIRYTRESSLQPGGPVPLSDCKPQDGRLDATGTLLLTYRDGSGRVVRRSKVYRDAHGGCGYISN